MFQERLDHFVELSLHDLVELVESQSDAVVGQSVLGEVVGPDPLAAVAGSDQAASLVGSLLVGFLLLGFEQSAAKHSQGLGPILVLALFVLALHDGIGWQVRDADGAGRLVDLLASGSTGEEGVDPEVIGSDFDFDLVGFGEHCDGGC